MPVEVIQFTEFKREWWNESAGGKRRENMEFVPVTINTDYVAWFRRYPVGGGIEFCDVYMADRGGNFIIDKTYEEMQGLLGCGYALKKPKRTKKAAH